MASHGPGRSRRSPLAACSISLLMMLELGPGCALFRKSEPTPPPFSKIALRTTVERNDDGRVEGDLHGDTTVKGLAIGLGTGTVAGGGIGLGWGTLACSPSGFLGPIAYAFCVMVSTVAGMVIGGVGGTVAGGVTGLPWQAAGDVNAALSALQQERNLEREFAAAVTDAIPARRQVGVDVAAGPAGGSQGEAEAIVTARLEEVDLRQHIGQRMSLRLRATMTQEWERVGEKPGSKICEYVYTSPIHEVEDWLLANGKAFDDFVTEGMRSISRWMARDLEAFATRTAHSASAGEPATCFQLED